jgi:hypothetical protein
MLNYIKNIFIGILTIPLIRSIFKKSPYYIFTNYPYSSDGLATRHNHDFKKEKDFLLAYEAIKPARMYWRAYILGWAAEHASRINGDFVECGTDEGGTALFVTKYLKFQNIKKKFFLIDTFAGLIKSKISKNEIILWEKSGRDPRNLYNYKKNNTFKIASDKFKNYKNIKIIKGIIPEILKKIQINKVSYLHIDLNCAKPEVEALKFFYPKLSRNAIVVFDDYGWQNHIHQKKLIDKFVKTKKQKILTLPTGQGLMIKN